MAVVGCGVGKSHAQDYKTLPEQFELRVVCDLDRAKAEETAAKFEVPHILTHFDAMCERDDLDVIDICTPPFVHFAQIEKALRSGKHVICEKPLVSSLAEVDRIIELEKNSKGRVMPIFQYRFGRGLQKLHYLVERGLTGDPFLATVETAWRRRADYYAVPWRGQWKTERGGAVLGHAIHAHDMLFYILGGARNVFARTATRVNPIETEDCASISLEMENGALASSSVTLGSSEEITRHRFCFRNLTAESHCSPYNNGTEPWKFIADSPDLQQQIDAALSQFVPEPEGFKGQFTRFWRAITAGTELPATLADARVALELVTAVYYSGETGKSVDLPITASHPRYKSWLPNQAVDENVGGAK